MSFKIGVDGGGTKTELILVDASGAIVARQLAAGCNPSQLGPEKAREILETALREITTKAEGGVTHTLLCMAGNRSFWKETADALSGSDFGAVSAVDDSRPVLELATDGAPGLVLHAGTGSFIAARAPDNSVHYAGGLGWKLGDPGSGFDLGRRAIAVALLELQAAMWSKNIALSPLANALCAHTGIADYTNNSRYFYNDAAANAQIAAFAPRVLELAAHDCGAAQQVVADSITDFARQADAVIQRLFPNQTTRVPCGVSGRILNSEPAAFVLRSLANKLKWPVVLQFIETAPIEGVRRLLAKV
ncbi:N-acetylglucosamine kinase [Oleiharenicola lentus]|uniref:N-acetylglucosamine kinase n=1 Tax=Oleiharenicola lentus TaxID=2508720 RepID=UPI003F67A92C